MVSNFPLILFGLTLKTQVLSFTMSIFVSLSFCLTVCHSVCQYVIMIVSMPLRLSVCHNDCQYVNIRQCIIFCQYVNNMFVSVALCLSVCPCVYQYVFMFASISLCLSSCFHVCQYFLCNTLPILQLLR